MFSLLRGICAQAVYLNCSVLAFFFKLNTNHIRKTHEVSTSLHPTSAKTTHEGEVFICMSIGTGVESFPFQFISYYVNNNRFLGFTLQDCSLFSLLQNQSCRIILQREMQSLTILLSSLRNAKINLFNYDPSFSDANAPARKVTCQKTDLRFLNGHYTFTIEFDDKSSMSFVCKDISAAEGTP